MADARPASGSPDPPPAQSRDLILDAAELLFATKGFAATTIKQIAAAAGVNSALLYYYFDSKETLYRETLRRILATMSGRGLEVLDHQASPSQAIRSLVGFQSAFLGSRPHLPRLLARELAGQETPDAMPMFGELLAGLFRRLCEIIRDGQRQGDFRADTTPEFAAISTISQVAYLHIARPGISRLLGHGANGPPPKDMANFARHAADFALAALRPEPAGAPSPSDST